LALLESFEPPESLEFDSFEPDSLDEPDSLAELDSVDDESFADDEESESADELAPPVDDFEDRESFTYQPLPLNTMPTG
jgi:hypothetical protein